MTSYTGFSEVDIVARFDGHDIGTIQDISYSVTRDRAPIYQMGSQSPIGYSRGQRHIAGELVFCRLDRELFRRLSEEVATREDRPWARDRIPPFDVILTAANEYGALSHMSISEIELMNSGYGVSIDDIVSEHSYTYIASNIFPWAVAGPRTILPPPETPRVIDRNIWALRPAKNLEEKTITIYSSKWNLKG